MKVLLVSLFGLAVMVGPLSVNVEAAELNLNKAYSYFSSDSAFVSSNSAFSRWSGGIVKIDNGNHFGWFNNNGNGRSYNSVPIPGTLLLFGGGFAGFTAWRWRVARRSEDRKPRIRRSHYPDLQSRP